MRTLIKNWTKGKVMTKKKTLIEWTDVTWNPVVGCTQVSPGCDNCYAKFIATESRLSHAFDKSFAVRLRPERMDQPKKWRKPRRIFVNSMSDLFHRDIPDDYLKAIWATMLSAHHHTYQVLTKRAHRMIHKIRELELPVTPHIWLGVSAENQKFADNRIPALLSIDAPVRWISAEPLLGPISIANHVGVDWVVVGGESGSGRRMMQTDWVRSLRDECQARAIPFFYKQGNHRWSGRSRELDGRLWEEFPNRE